MSKRDILILFSFGLLIVTLLVTNCSETQPVVSNHYIDSSFTRTQQIEKCGGCHKEVYDNWKKGPHANALRLLEAHNRISPKDHSFPTGYIEFVNQRFNSVCASCHTGQNLYETNFKSVNHTLDMKELNMDSFPDFLKQAFTRTNARGQEIRTGIDCMTCHAQGNKVVTNSGSSAVEKNGIIKSRLFSDNMNCYSCHHHQVTTMKELVNEGKIKQEINCVGCHQEYNSTGKPSHYFYWRHDSLKQHPKHLNIFETAQIIFENGAWFFKWNNTMMPHGFSECGEAMCSVIAVTKGERRDTLLNVRINRKNFFDKQKNYPNHFSKGINGFEFNYNEEIKLPLDKINIERIKTLIVAGAFKPQYWSTNEQFKTVYSKDYSPGDRNH